MREKEKKMHGPVSQTASSQTDMEEAEKQEIQNERKVKGNKAKHR